MSNALSIIWTIAKMLFQILIVFGVFAVASTGFERVVIFILVEIYYNLIMFVSLYFRDQTSWRIEHYKNQKELHGQDLDEDERHEIKTLEEKLNQPSYWISLVAIYIIHVIAFLNLLSAILA